MPDLGQSIKNVNLVLHTLGSIIRSSIESNSSKKNSKYLELNKFNVKESLNTINEANSIIYKEGFINALDELLKLYTQISEKINKLDQKLFNIKTKEEFNKSKKYLKKEYEKILKYLNTEPKKIETKIKDKYVYPKNLDTVKSKLTTYISTIFDLINNSKYYRPMNEEEFSNKFKFDSSEVFKLYKTIPYNNINQIGTFINILNNIKLNTKAEKENKLINSEKNPL